MVSALVTKEEVQAAEIDELVKKSLEDLWQRLLPLLQSIRSFRKRRLRKCSGSLITYFAFPENNPIKGWLFKAYDGKETVKVLPGEEKILAAIAFDEGNGVRVFDCEILISESERLESAEHMLVIRACFGSGPEGEYGNEPVIPYSEVY